MIGFGGRLLLAGMLLLVGGCARSKASTRTERTQSSDLAHQDSRLAAEPLQPLSRLPAEDPRLVELGARLFRDPILSKDGSVACANCHDLDAGGDDGRRFSLGVGDKEGTINSPTVFNAALNIAQFWDGRAATLEEQIDGPVEHEAEMADRWENIEKKLNQSASYRSDFQAALGANPTRQGVKQAIAAFERTLITVDSPFDRWLKGDESALTPEQREGYDLFKTNGCIACHQGQNAGGNMFQRFGVFGNYFADRGKVRKEDLGRFNVTGQEADKHVFRVPSLRNVELTAPYFHDGSVETLPEAVGIMARYQLGRPLSNDQVDKIVAFLKSLTGPKRAYLATREGVNP